MLKSIISGLVSATLWHLFVMWLSKRKGKRIRASLQLSTSSPVHDTTLSNSVASNCDPSNSVAVTQGPIRASLGSYTGIHRSPYLYIRNAGAISFDVLAVVFNIANYGEFLAPHETDDGEGTGPLRLTPSKWGKWIFCCGRNIPEQYDELVSCSIRIQYKATLGIQNNIDLPVQGDLFESLKKQLKENKRGSPWPSTSAD